MDKRFLMIIGAIIIVFGGIVWFNNHSDSKNGSSNTQPTNHVEGEGQSGVTLVEYGDYQCPYCSEYYQTVKQVVSDYSTQIHFQFRNLPLTQVHQNAFAGSRAAEAAALQNKFWEMHDLLYENQDQWTSSSSPQTVFNQYATQLGLNLNQFKTDYASQKVNNLINADIDAFNKTGETMETPTFFLDGKKVNPANNENAFKTILDAEIAKKTKK